MRKILYIVLIGLFVGCDDMLDVTPETAVTFTNYFKTEQDAEALVTELHYNLWASMGVYNASGLYLCEIMGLIYDETTNTTATDLLRRNPETWQGPTWQPAYTTIYKCNLLIDNAYRFIENGVTQEALEPYLQQAYFVKGYSYYFLALHWGEAPIVEDSYTQGELAKSSISEVWDEAEKWALLAMDLDIYENLKDYSGNARNTKQYGSKGAAAALLANIYASRAAIEDKPEYWSKAEAYCDSVINGHCGYYALAEDPEAVCIDVMHGHSDESIFEIQHEDNTAAGAYVGEQLIGFPLNTSYSPNSRLTYILTRETAMQLFDEDDKRRAAYFYELDSNELTLDGTTYTDLQYAFVYKFRYPLYQLYTWNPTPTYTGQDINKIIWRLADIMLLRAECRVRQGKANAAEDLNTIRERAYGDRSHDYTAAEGDLQRAIFREREKELFLEGKRYYDMIRNGYWRELSPNFEILTDDDVAKGALYFATPAAAFERNDLMRQNEYWLEFMN